LKSRQRSTAQLPKYHKQKLSKNDAHDGDGEAARLCAFTSVIAEAAAGST
jgi:hypothetical protein